MIEAEVYTLSMDMWRRVEVSLESLRRFGIDDFIFRRVEIKTHLFIMELCIGQFVKIILTSIYHLMLILRDLKPVWPHVFNTKIHGFGQKCKKSSVWLCIF